MNNKLYLSSEIYSIESIREAIEAYRELADISIEEINGIYVLSFRNCQYDEYITKCEFENYCIGLTNDM
ncbi:HxsD-like protein [Lachnoclostridium sp. Marseille-P6806]|uniref:HxsD-like protein n=1 Tax=Lachnoclostridium sp. Marseille-P6806 TaxID=2364793 RepID=UPI001031B8B0|nr:HxsD-like protein [Lachnoclostridium sp. Marseille-P6806]